jgi:hypothetical protein
MKKFFFARSQRERLLLTVFASAILLWWGSTLIDRIDFARMAWADSSERGEKQAHWISRKEEVAERMAKISSRLDPARTLNASQAFAEVNRLAQGMAVELGAPRTERTDNIAMHSLQATIRRTDLRSLVNFYQQLSAKAPYLGVDQLSVTTERSAPGQVTAVFKLYSVEVGKSPAP